MTEACWSSAPRLIVWGSSSRAPGSSAAPLPITIAVTCTGAFALPVSAIGTTGAPSSLMRRVGDEIVAPAPTTSSSETSA